MSEPTDNKRKRRATDVHERADVGLRCKGEGLSGRSPSSSLSLSSRSLRLGMSSSSPSPSAEDNGEGGRERWIDEIG